MSNLNVHQVKIRRWTWIAAILFSIIIFFIIYYAATQHPPVRKMPETYDSTATK